MVLDHIDNADRYCALHPSFSDAITFLRGAGLTDLEAGRQEVDGHRLYAMVVVDSGKGQQAARLEAHRAYIDIQFSVDCTDVIGWKRVADCSEGPSGYDAETDLELFDDPPEAWIAIPPNHFAIFFPEDAHAPMAAEGDLHKVVMKIAVGE